MYVALILSGNKTISWPFTSLVLWERCIDEPTSFLLLLFVVEKLTLIITFLKGFHCWQSLHRGFKVYLMLLWPYHWMWGWSFPACGRSHSVKKWLIWTLPHSSLFFKLKSLIFILKGCNSQCHEIPLFFSDFS